MSEEEFHEHTYTDSFHGFKREVTLVLNKESKVVQQIVDFPIGVPLDRFVRQDAVPPERARSVAEVRTTAGGTKIIEHPGRRPCSRPVRRTPNQQE